MMRYRHNRGYRYRCTNPPQALLKARLDNIAIVPASMLPLTETLKEKVNKQLPLSSRRNVLPMERIDGALLMSHEYATRALVELMQIGQTPPGANP